MLSKELQLIKESVVDKTYFNKKILRTTLVIITGVFIYALYLNNWTISGSYIYCPEEGNYQDMLGRCGYLDEYGELKYLLPGEKKGKLPHPKTDSYTNLFYIILFGGIILNHAVWRIKKHHESKH